MVRNATLDLHQVLIMDSKKTGLSYHMICFNASVTQSAISVLLFYVNPLIRIHPAHIGGVSS